MTAASCSSSGDTSTPGTVASEQGQGGTTSLGGSGSVAGGGAGTTGGTHSTGGAPAVGGASSAGAAGAMTGGTSGAGVGGKSDGGTGGGVGGNGGGSGSAGSSGTLGGGGTIGGGGSSGNAGSGNAGTAGSSNGGAAGTGAGGAPTCDPVGASGPCYPTDPSCGVVGSSCMARISNCGAAVKTFRVSQLHLSAPSKLTSKLVAYTIIGAGIDLPLPVCHLQDGAMGSFNWLLALDTVSGALTTGSAKPNDNPDAGYCYMHEMVSGALVTKRQSPFASDGSGQISTTTPIPKIALPIYTSASPPASPLTLPLSQLVFHGMALSENDSCIGRFRGNTGELDDQTCRPTTVDPMLDTSFQWTNGGTVTAYITLEDADALAIDLLGGSSLCTVLTGQSSPDDTKHCARDASGQIVPKGDTSSVEHPGSMDAVSLTGTFAASAVEILGDCP